MLELVILQLKISCSKSDQLRNGDKVVIARTGPDTCPVAMLEKYLSQAVITSLNSNGMLFRAIVSGKVEKLKDSGGLSDTRMSELLKES